MEDLLSDFELPSLAVLADLLSDISMESEEGPALNHIANLIRVHAARQEPREQ